MSAINRLPKLALITAFLLLAACQTKNIRQDYNLEDARDMALVIGSASQNQGLPMGVVSEFYLNYKVSKAMKTFHAKDIDDFTGTMFSKHDFETDKLAGRIFVIEVPAGRHAVDQWKILHGDRFVYPKVTPPELGFDIQPGEIMYVGSYHMQVLTGKNFFGMSLAAGGIPVIHDEQERDIRLFRERYPQFSEREVKINVLHQGVWANEATEEEELVIPKSE